MTKGIVIDKGNRYGLVEINVELWMMKVVMEVLGSEWRKELGAQELQLLLQLQAAQTRTPRALMALTPSQLALLVLAPAQLALLALTH
ncbi:hypothetical protein Taro_052202 [Colocasia esculenta]|uniref:Uncharacterized protein n=1 Tax=Colocasia esculenta TaxID=4460 RepID=A0A843XIY3_COLES|nr:hypothetical protein [Colocasia esculenta]